MPTDPLWLPSISYDETELRKMDLPLVMSDGTAQGARAGIRPGDPGLTVTLAGTTVNVSAGSATIYKSGQGLYRAQLAASSPGTLSAANATFSRIDLVYLRVWDTAVDASGLRKADTVYLVGTPSGSPVAPSPGGTEIYIPLATITVPNTGAGGTGSATVSSAARQVTVAPGGILPVSSAADIAISGAYVGQTRYNTVRGLPEFWTGSAWVAQGDWQAFTPTWACATGTNPAIGNGNISARYTIIGKTVLGNIRMVAGSTTTFGTGAWTWTLPVAGRSSYQMSIAGSFSAYDNSGGFAAIGTPWINDGESVMRLLTPTGAGNAGANSNLNVPFTWAVSDRAVVDFSYEAA
jgi:hypothetical protein